MTIQEFLDEHYQRLSDFTSKQISDFNQDFPNKADHFIKRSHYLSQQIIENSNDLISDVYSDENLDPEQRVIIKGTSIPMTQFLLMGVSKNQIECLKRFDDAVEKLFIQSFE
ncbi:hypothetical protein LX97_03486 [Nonlabens dokdonensis]|jgi:hypothetical protein|uniref:Uncharacterized protein n=1 Tax=Nonlabens dokdonensis TaxID=328515 RepID=A0ABX5PTQ6_9FLAO|nr:hypothetical protein [Nonlabens dokdonensis]PZX36195.1 hypothetical protein LX97_03486 [Nonlabens dokdonensis]